MSVPTGADDYAEWRQTGKLPDKPSKKEDSATSKSSVTEPESEPGTKTRQPKKPAADARKEELNREIRELISKRDQVRLEVESAGKKDVKPAEPSPAPPSEPQAGERPRRPRQEDFKTWEQYETAQDQYLERLADWKAAQKIEEAIQKTRQEAATQAMQVKLNDAKSRYGDEAEPAIIDTAKTVFDDQKIAPAIKTAIGRSDVLVDALYVMGSDRNELSAFLDLAQKDPLEALRKWFTVETLVKQELGRVKPPEPEPQRTSDGRFQAAKTLKPPAPPTELNGNSAPAGDERDRAVASGNVRAFFQEGNRRDFAKWKGHI